jgi:hypothetical protein
MANRPRGSRSVGRLGGQPPRYRFFLNPYTDARFMKCPQCLAKTRQRKLPLVIHIEPLHLVSLNKTCRYCPNCDLLIAHQDQLEAWLTAFFSDQRPDVVGNEYVVLGTQDRADWLHGVHTPVSFTTAFDHMHDFSEVVRFTPLPSWVKQ